MCSVVGFLGHSIFIPSFLKDSAYTSSPKQVDDSCGPIPDEKAACVTVKISVETLKNILQKTRLVTSAPRIPRSEDPLSAVTDPE